MNSASRSYQGFSPQPPFLSRGNRNRLSCSASCFSSFARKIDQTGREAYIFINKQIRHDADLSPPDLTAEPIINRRTGGGGEGGGRIERVT